MQEGYQNDIIFEEGEDFIQNKYGYCFYSMEGPIIYNLFIHPWYRNLGHAKKLLQLVIHTMRVDGCDCEIYIEVDRSLEDSNYQRLKALYTGLGLRVL